MKLSLQFAGLTDPGQVRAENEDNWTADSEQGLFIVADGMGGEFAGALASRIVIATLPTLVAQAFATRPPSSKHQARRRMKAAIATLSRQLREQTQNEPGLDGMGSTVVCALVRGAAAVVGHMGDSRVYRLRGGRLKQLTKDHSLVHLLIKTGDITAEEAATHPARGRLTRCVGMDGAPLPQASVHAMKPGDLLLLCTDGLTGMLSDERIATALKERMPLGAKCQHLVDAANEAGGKDNITVLLLCFTQSETDGALSIREAGPRCQ
jgi:protein phosphatase